jgi:hypothetical protein
MYAKVSGQNGTGEYPRNVHNAKSATYLRFLRYA